MFRPLQSERTTVVAKEDLLPRWVRRVDTLRIGLRSNVWVHARGAPIRGWLLQQLVKLAVAEQLTADVLVHADSDVVLVRPFSVTSVVDGDGRVRLYTRPDAVDEGLPNHVLWHRSAEKLLGLGPAGLPMPDFISSLVPWRRENAVALLAQIEKTTGRHWLAAVAAAWDVSEYTLYGRFAQDALGTSGRQFVSSSPLCLDYYKRVPLTVPELTTFLERVDQDAIAVSLTSKAGMKPEDYVDLLERRWDAPMLEEPDDAHAGSGRRELEAPRGPEGVTRQSSRRPALHPHPARPASVDLVGSSTRRRRTLERATRSGAMAAVLALLALMFVLFGLGMD